MGGPIQTPIDSLPFAVLLFEFVFQLVGIRL